MSYSQVLLTRKCVPDARVVIIATLRHKKIKESFVLILFYTIHSYFALIIRNRIVVIKYIGWDFINQFTINLLYWYY